MRYTRMRRTTLHRNTVVSCLLTAERGSFVVSKWTVLNSVTQPRSVNTSTVDTAVLMILTRYTVPQSVVILLRIFVVLFTHNYATTESIMQFVNTWHVVPVTNFNYRTGGVSRRRASRSVTCDNAQLPMLSEPCSCWPVAASVGSGH